MGSSMELTIHEKYLLLLQISHVHRMAEFIIGTCRSRHGCNGSGQL